MRNQEVINKFFAGADKARSNNNNLRIEFGRNGARMLVNYSTPLATIDGDRLILNKTKYSVTTSKIQNCIAGSFKSFDFAKVEEFDNLDMGYFDFLKKI